MGASLGSLIRHFVFVEELIRGSQKCFKGRRRGSLVAINRKATLEVKNDKGEEKTFKDCSGMRTRITRILRKVTRGRNFQQEETSTMYLNPKLNVRPSSCPVCAHSPLAVRDLRTGKITVNLQGPRRPSRT